MNFQWKNIIQHSNIFSLQVKTLWNEVTHNHSRISNSTKKCGKMQHSLGDLNLLMTVGLGLFLNPKPQRVQNFSYHSSVAIGRNIINLFTAWWLERKLERRALWWISRTWRCAKVQDFLSNDFDTTITL